MRPEGDVTTAGVLAVFEGGDDAEIGAVAERLLETPDDRYSPQDWVQLIGALVAVGRRSDAAALMSRLLEAHAGDEWLEGEAAWLRRWFEPAAVDETDVDGPPRVALLDYRHTERRYASANIGDPTQTLAMAGQLLRLPNVRLSIPDPGVDEALSQLVVAVDPADEDQRARGDIEIVTVDRDFTTASPVPRPTWLFAFGWYMWPLVGQRFDFPFAPGLRPIFVSFHVSDHRMLTPDALEYLNAHGPVGCRDLATVRLLRERGVEAFFSGCVTTTMSNVVSAQHPSRSALARRNVVIDADDSGVAQPVRLQQADFDMFERDFAGNLLAAWRRVAVFRDAQSVTTSRLHCYLPSRSLGADVDFRPEDADDPRFGGLVGIDQAEFDRIRAALNDRLAQTIGAIASGVDEQGVYELWRTLWADRLDEAQSAASTTAAGNR